MIETRSAHKIAFITILVGILLIILSGTVYSAKISQLSNGGFESGSLSPWSAVNWTYGNPADNGQYTIISTEQAQEGAYSAKLHCIKTSGTLWNYALELNNVNITGYDEISWYMRSTDNRSQLYLSTYRTNGTKEHYNLYYVQSGIWTRYYFNLANDLSDRSVERLDFYGYQNNVSTMTFDIYIDNITLINYTTDTEYYLNGTVKEEFSEIPIRGSNVDVYSGSILKWSNTTDTNGNYLVNVPDAGTYTIKVNSTGYYESDFTVNQPNSFIIVNGGKKYAKTDVYQVGYYTNVNLYARDNSDKSILSNATYGIIDNTLGHTVYMMTVTGAENVSLIQYHNYTITACVPGYANVSQTFNNSASSSRYFDMTQWGGIGFILDGQLQDGNNQTGIDGTVTIKYPNGTILTTLTTTEGRGYYGKTVTNATTGIYTIIASVPGYNDTYKYLTFPDDFITYGHYYPSSGYYAIDGYTIYMSRNDNPINTTWYTIHTYDYSSKESLNSLNVIITNSNDYDVWGISNYFGNTAFLLAYGTYTVKAYGIDQNSGEYYVQNSMTFTVPGSVNPIQLPLMRKSESVTTTPSPSGSANQYQLYAIGTDTGEFIPATFQVTDSVTFGTMIYTTSATSTIPYVSTLQLVDNRIYTITCTSPGYKSKSITQSWNGGNSGIAFYLDTDSGAAPYILRTGAISSTTSPWTGLPGFTISVIKPDGSSIDNTTNSLGQAEFNLGGTMQSGTYQVFCSKDGYKLIEQDVKASEFHYDAGPNHYLRVVQFFPETTVTPTPTPGDYLVYLRISPIINYWNVAIDCPNGSVLQAKISDGNYHYFDIGTYPTPGTYTLDITALGYHSKTLTFTISDFTNRAIYYDLTMTVNPIPTLIPKSQYNMKLTVSGNNGDNNDFYYYLLYPGSYEIDAVTYTKYIDGLLSGGPVIIPLEYMSSAPDGTYTLSVSKGGYSDASISFDKPGDFIFNSSDSCYYWTHSFIMTLSSSTPTPSAEPSAYVSLTPSERDAYRDNSTSIFLALIVPLFGLFIVLIVLDIIGRGTK